MNKTLISLLLILGFISCKKESDSDNTTIATAPITAVVEAPSSGQVNQAISFKLTVAYPDGCTTFSKFIETQQSKTESVEVETTHPKDANCTLAIVYEAKTYTFTPTEKGTYTFKFKNYDSWIEKVVTVE